MKLMNENSKIKNEKKKKTSFAILDENRSVAILIGNELRAPTFLELAVALLGEVVHLLGELR